MMDPLKARDAALACARKSGIDTTGAITPPLPDGPSARWIVIRTTVAQTTVFQGTSIRLDYRYQDSVWHVEGDDYDVRAATAEESARVRQTLCLDGGR